MGGLDDSCVYLMQWFSAQLTEESKLIGGSKLIDKCVGLVWRGD